jgi:hypothetical protein
MDDFVGDPDTFFWVVTSRLVSHGDSPLDSPAKSKCFSETHLKPAMTEVISIVSNGTNQAALVGLFQTASHLFGSTEASPVVAIGVMQGAFEGVSIHICNGSGSTLWAVWH